MENKGGYCGILFDDGEKFGVWPKTYEWVYEKGWFDRFMSLFSGAEHKFELYEEFVKRNKPNGFAYLPLTSYMEMGEWSLFADKFIELKNLENFLKTTDYKGSMQTFVKGAIWKNFLVKYPECNHIHKRTLKLSKENVYNNEKLTDLIYRAQCNDVLWHGIFGGIYLPNLRDNAYKYIIEAEAIVDFNKSHIDKIYEEDIFMDGYSQVVANTKGVKYIFNTGVGAGLVSLDLKNYGLNLQNTMSRRFEGYHNQLLENRKGTVEDTGISTIHEMSVELSDEVKGKIAFDWRATILMK
jgi:alpha-amylase/alpha-mannosidase (GH57 family)